MNGQSAQVNAMFNGTKLLCFGRYAVAVPKEAKIIWGEAAFPSTILSMKADGKALKEKVEKDIDTIMAANKTAEISLNGPIQNGWQLRYFEDRIAKQVNFLFLQTYILIANDLFIIRNAVKKMDTESEVAALAMKRANSLRARDEDEVPQQSGNCIENGFMLDTEYEKQEIVSVGICLPSFPDVIFSISSNKNAYSDYPNADFERMKVEELSLLARIRSAQARQGINYPSRTLLREGKRRVQHWTGEESLIRRTDGVHDFEWGFVGKPKDVANPSEMSVHMFSKVDSDIVGAAKSSSVDDTSAVVLWDHMLAGLKFRVAVPGAPQGSFYYDEKVGGIQNAAAANP